MSRRSSLRPCSPHGTAGLLVLAELLLASTRAAGEDLPSRDELRLFIAGHRAVEDVLAFPEGDLISLDPDGLLIAWTGDGARVRAWTEIPGAIDLARSGDSAAVFSEGLRSLLDPVSLSVVEQHPVSGAVPCEGVPSAWWWTDGAVGFDSAAGTGTLALDGASAPAEPDAARCFASPEETAMEWVSAGALVRVVADAGGGMGIETATTPLSDDAGGGEGPAPESLFRDERSGWLPSRADHACDTVSPSGTPLPCTALDGQLVSRVLLPAPSAWTAAAPARDSLLLVAEHAIARVVADSDGAQLLQRAAPDLHLLGLAGAPVWTLGCDPPDGDAPGRLLAERASDGLLSAWPAADACDGVARVAGPHAAIALPSGLVEFDATTGLFSFTPRSGLVAALPTHPGTGVGWDLERAWDPACAGPSLTLWRTLHGERAEARLGPLCDAAIALQPVRGENGQPEGALAFLDGEEPVILRFGARTGDEQRWRLPPGAAPPFSAWAETGGTLAVRLQDGARCECDRECERIPSSAGAEEEREVTPLWASSDSWIGLSGPWLRFECGSVEGSVFLSTEGLAAVSGDRWWASEPMLRRLVLARGGRAFDAWSEEAAETWDPAVVDSLLRACGALEPPLGSLH